MNGKFFSFFVFLLCALILFYLPLSGQEEFSAVNAYKTGRAYFANKEYEKAISQFKKAISINSRYTDAHFGLAQAYLASKKHVEAATSFRKVIYLDDQFLDAYLYLAETLFLKGDREEAHREIKKVLQKSRFFAKGYYAQGVFYYREGDLDKAIHSWEEALRYDKKMASAHCNLGWSFYNKGETEKALEHLREAVLLEPGRGLFALNLGWVLFREGKREETSDKVQQALRTASPPFSYCFRAILDIFSEKWPEVRENAAKALQHDPDLLGAHLLFAFASEKEGMVADARIHYEAVLNQDPLSRDAKEGMKRLEGR